MLIVNIGTPEKIIIFMILNIGTVKTMNYFIVFQNIQYIW